MEQEEKKMKDLALMLATVSVEPFFLVCISIYLVDEEDADPLLGTALQRYVYKSSVMFDKTDLSFHHCVQQNKTIERRCEEEFGCSKSCRNYSQRQWRDS